MGQDVTPTGNPIFPDDILDLILEIVRNDQTFEEWYSTLRSFSLVNSSLRHGAQKRLFRTILVDFCCPLNNIMRLAEVYAQNPLLPRYVEKLSIVRILGVNKNFGCSLQGPDFDSIPDHLVDCRAKQEEVLADILSLFGGGQLRELQLFSGSHQHHFNEEVFEWAFLAQSLQEALLAASSNLESLVVVNGNNVPVDILRHTQLKTVKLFDCSVDMDTGTAIEWPGPHEAPANLKMLVLASPNFSDSDIHYFTDITELVNLTALESLTVDTYSKELLDVIISVCRTTIKHLRFFFEPELEDDIPNLECIGQCSSLTKLEFMLNISKLDSASRDPFQELAKLQVSSSLKAVSINFKVWGTEAPPRESDFVEWAERTFPTLDHSLSQPQWRTLQSVEIVLCGEFANSWFSRPLTLSTGFMPEVFRRGLVKTLIRTHEEIFSTTALYERSGNPMLRDVELLRGDDDELEMEDEDDNEGGADEFRRWWNINHSNLNLSSGEPQQ